MPKKPPHREDASTLHIHKNGKVHHRDTKKIPLKIAPHCGILLEEARGKEPHNHAVYHRSPGPAGVPTSRCLGTDQGDVRTSLWSRHTDQPGERTGWWPVQQHLPDRAG